MPKLSISCAEWLGSASYGNLEQLERWFSSGALDIRYDPVHVGVVGKQGRARIFDVCDQDKRNALFVALASGQVAYALRLMELGKFAATKARDGRTPMHPAALLPEKAPTVIRKLVEQGHGVDVSDNKGDTPLMLAIRNKREETVQALLEQGADPNGDLVGDPPLDRAVGTQQVGMVQLLLSAGADPNKRKAGFDVSPLHTLAANWDNEDVDPKSENSRIMRLLVDAGADPDATLSNNGSEMTMEQVFYRKSGVQALRQAVADKQASDLASQTVPSMASARSPRL